MGTCKYKNIRVRYLREGLHCCVAGTMVSIDGFISRPIEQLVENIDMNVLTYDIENKYSGCIYEKQTNFINQGEKECMELTFEDGRTLTCTPDHKILTINGWKEAQEIILNEDKILIAPENPSLIRTELDLREEKEWSFNIDDYKFVTDTFENIKKSCAFVRILGYLLTDGCLTKDKKYNSFQASIYMGHSLDVESIQQDLKLAFNKTGKMRLEGNCYKINLDANIAKILSKINGIPIGKRIIQSASLPTFILSAPRIIQAHFLAGLFGGGGVAPSSKLRSSGKMALTYNLGFVFSKVSTEDKSSIEYQNQLIRLLKGFNITSYISSKSILPIKKDGLLKYKHLLSINVDNIPTFYKQIGFAHCSSKHCRLAIASSLIRLRTNIKQQNDEISKNFDIITNYSKFTDDANTFKLIGSKKASFISKNIDVKMDDARKIAIKISKYNSPIFGHIKSAASIRAGLIGKTNGTVPFIDDEEILKNWDAYNWFRNNITNDELPKNIKLRTHTNTSYAVPRERDTIPCMKMKIIYRKNVGIKKTYDITVNRTSNFIANGVVVHNCKFAVEIYSLLKNKLSSQDINEIMKEGVEISKNFMTDALPVSLIGMNHVSMCNYIEYIGDRLLILLGYKKIYNKTNPFKFMETIGLNDKTNFFETRPHEYQDSHIMNKSSKNKIIINSDGW